MLAGTTTVLLFLLYGLTSLESAPGQLIRPIHVYEELIRNIHDYFNNTCIILLHATVDPLQSQGLQEGDGLLALQLYLSATLHIRTSIMDFQMFKDRVGLNYYHIKRPLFVLLNDQPELKDQFKHVSTWIAMAYPTWLIFLRDQVVLSEFFADIYVPFDCVMLATRSTGRGEAIRDVYRIHRGDRLRSGHFGSWDPEKGLRATMKGLWQRRNNLYGHNIRVATVHDPPVSLIQRNERNEVTGIGGFFGEVIDLLREGTNCTFSFREATSGGAQLSNGSWNGAMAMLVKNEIDLAAAAMMMISDRLGTVEFTTPIYSTKCRTYIKRPESTAVNWYAYLAPFSRRIWYSIGLLILVACIGIMIVNGTIKSFGAPIRDYPHAPTRFTEVLFHTFGAFCSQGMEPSLLDPVRLIQLVVHLTAVVVVAAYSAALISFLAIKGFVMPFTTMEGLLEDGTYRFAVIADSADYSFFQNTTDKVLAVMFDELLTRETDLPGNYLDGLSRVCGEKKYAFMTMDNMAAVLQDRVGCILEPLDVMMQTTVSMAMSSGNPYLGLINSNILLLRDSGILQRLLKAEWSKRGPRPQSTWTSVELEDVLPLLFFMLAFLAVSCVIFLMENVVYGRLTVSRNHRGIIKSNKRKG